MSGKKKNVLGEGNYEASKQYNDATRKFIDSGRVDAAARAAHPKTPQEAEEMVAAEEAGKNQAILHRTKSLPAAGTPPRFPGNSGKS